MKLRYAFLGIALIPVMLLPVSGLQHESELKQLYDGRQWFRLRDAVLNGDAPELYRGAVACAFHDLENAEKHLRKVISAAPRSEDATEARGLLITVYQLANEYGKAFAEIRALQAADPNERGLDNGAVFFRILERFPRPRTMARGRATVRGRFYHGNLFVPVSVNGKTAHYIIDTGANFSAMPESEARRLGLTVHDARDFHGSDAAGSKVPMRVGVADRLSVGSFRIEHPVFLILKDDQMPFADLPPDCQGVLGIPVLLAMERIRWDRDAVFEIGFPSSNGAIRDANLCLSGANVVVNGEFGHDKISFFLDTGATSTRLSPRFAEEFKSLVQQSGSKRTTKVTGVGGSAEVEVIEMPRLQMRIGGFEALLEPATILTKDPGGNAEWYHVWAGIDIFERAKRVSIDFRAMRLSAE